MNLTWEWHKFSFLETLAHSFESRLTPFSGRFSQRVYWRGYFRGVRSMLRVSFGVMIPLRLIKTLHCGFELYLESYGGHSLTMGTGGMVFRLLDSMEGKMELVRTN